MVALADAKAMGPLERQMQHVYWTTARIAITSPVNDNQAKNYPLHISSAVDTAYRNQNIQNDKLNR